MDARQRFHETMRYGSPDHPPLFREGMREEVIQAWLNQGLDSEAALSEIFNYDPREEIQPNLEPRAPVLTGNPLRVDLERLREDLDPEDEGRMPEDWQTILQSPREYEHVRMLDVHEGFFLSMVVEEWASFAPVMELTIERPNLVREIMRITGEFCAAMAARILQEIEVDAVVFGEPISGAHGSLISPQMYADLILPSYEPVLDVVEACGVETIIWRTYANSRVLLPEIVKTRMNCLWSTESNIQAMDYISIREAFGKDLRLIGGIDTDAIIAGPEAMQVELETKLPPLLKQGGYIPLADGRIRKYVPFEHYAIYRELLEEYVTASRR